MASASAQRVALLYPGDRETRDRADPIASRFAALFEAFAEAGVVAEPAIWHDDFADEVESQLRGMQAVLAWFNPIEGGRRRDRLDSVLRRTANHGVLVSAHPEAVLRLGTKDVLFETRHLPFGSDVHRVESLKQLGAESGGSKPSGRARCLCATPSGAASCKPWTLPTCWWCWRRTSRQRLVVT